MFEAAAQAGNEGGRPRAAAGGAGAAGAGAGAGAAAAGGEALPNLEFLRSNPHFQQLRQLVQQQPQMLEPILQQVAAGNPQIAQLIGQNEEQFLQLLSEDGDDVLPPGTQTISVTEEERDAIEGVCFLPYFDRLFSKLITNVFLALPPWVLAGLGYSSVLCLRQERRACRQLSVREPGRSRRSMIVSVGFWIEKLLSISSSFSFFFSFLSSSVTTTSHV